MRQTDVVLHLLAADAEDRVRLFGGDVLLLAFIEHEIEQLVDLLGAVEGVAGDRLGDHTGNIVCQ